ncbi:MAG TPA: hypothetical protein DER09_09370 [Prolixibacteraceae bacterium]|nr:hypothetical protein [Prolixibacteraceae bacterium]
MFENRNYSLKRLFIILIFLANPLSGLYSQNNTKPDFTFGNASYFNMNSGETVLFGNTEIKLLGIKNQFNRIMVGDDTIQCRVSRRTPPVVVKGLRIFVADNFKIKSLSEFQEAHGLLKKEAIICVSFASQPLLNSFDYTFPVSFNDGFVWSCDEDSYLFSFKNHNKKSRQSCFSEGIDFDLQEARGIEKHWIVAVEKCTVAWVFEDENLKNEASILLQSNSHPDIFYLYSHLYNKKVEVKKGQTIDKGEILGTIWGDNNWGHLTFTVIKSDSLPEPGICAGNLINAFPHFFELYFQSSAVYSRNYRKGRLFFGKPAMYNGNQKNATVFEEYTGKGWIAGDWNIAEKVETASKGAEGNVRLRKVLFEGTVAEAKNPNNWFDYEIHVPNGTYRIRARLGDVEMESWQKIAFEKVDAGAIATEKGQFVWTSERVVKVTDGKLTVRINIDETNEKIAGISEIVFQQAN